MSPRPALALLLLGAFAIGFSPSFVRLSEIGPVATAIHRVALALPLLFLLVAMGKGGGLARPQSRGDWAGVVLAGLFFAGDLAFWHWAITNTSVANATLFATSTPIFVTLAGWAWLGERISARFLFGLGLGIGGGALLAVSSLRTTPAHLFGDLMGLVTALFFSGYLIVVKRLRARLSAAAVMAWPGLVTVAALVALNLFTAEAWVPASAKGWAILLALALVSHAIGQGPGGAGAGAAAGVVLGARHAQRVAVRGADRLGYPRRGGNPPAGCGRGRDSCRNRRRPANHRQGCAGAAGVAGARLKARG